jgi:predicted nucleic acid-binding protein
VAGDPLRQSAASFSFDVVVLDANVVYPAALRDLLLRLAEARLYQPRWSAQILDELRRNLIADGRSTEVRVRRMLAQMQQTFPDSEFDPSPSTIELMTNAVEDRHVLATAVESGAGLIVTGNLRDFPPPALSPWRMTARLPDEFLQALFDADPATMVRVLGEQAAALVDPPLTLDDVLDALELHVPRFVATIRARNI